MNEKELLIELNKWFDKKENILIRSKNIWARNLIASFLKNKLKHLGHWKNKSTGRKGNLIQLENMRKVRANKLNKEKQDKLNKDFLANF